MESSVFPGNYLLDDPKQLPPSSLFSATTSKFYLCHLPISCMCFNVSELSIALSLF